MWIFSVVGVVCCFIYLSVMKRKKRKEYILNFEYSIGLLQKFSKKYPQFSNEELKMIQGGLREWFLVCHSAKGDFVSMPSKIVDELWHEFILFTKEYNVFCKKALGKFLHHMPSEGMKKMTGDNAGLKLAWKLSCEINGIVCKRPSKLPHLFAVDSLLDIEGGFVYHLADEKPETEGSRVFSVNDIGCSFGDISRHSKKRQKSNTGGIFSFSGCSSDSGGDSSCGGGCGGE